MTKKLQITVDDGPEPVATALDGILAEIKTRNITAAFFNLGQEVQSNPSATKKIVDAGHVLGNHSWDHLMPKTSDYTDAQIKQQFSDTHAEVISATQLEMKHWRAPRLKAISRLSGLLTGTGNLYQFTHCDIHADSKDSQGSTTASAMLTAIRNDIAANPGRTTFRLLFHVKPTTASALKAVLDGLVSDGHSIVDFTQTS
ncbi:MAG: polysaccharide deacetylase family protein [Colwellia sp.]|jgi:Predicted xylanase/chitin deacetylase